MLNQVLDNVDWEQWRRGSAPFETTLGRYQINSIQTRCKGERILDLGCGDGIITGALSKQFGHVMGVDGSSQMIERARLNFPNASFVCQDIDKFDTIEKFDTILMIDVIEHLHQPGQILQNIQRWLAKDGILIVHTPNANSLNRRIGVKMGLMNDTHDLSDHDRQVGHMQIFDIDTLSSLMNRCGYRVVISEGIFLKPLANNQMQKLYESDLWETGDLKQKYFDALFSIGKELPEYANILTFVCVSK